MPILSMSAGRVTAIWGNAYVQRPDGSLKVLQVGDKVAGGSRIITEDDGIVEISPTKGPSVLLSGAPAQASVEKVIAGIESQDPQQVPAAGLEGGAEGGLRPGLRVERVNESSGPAGLYAFTGPGDAGEGPFASSADQRARLSVDDPRVMSIEVKAFDGNYVYYGISLSGTSKLPTVLTLKLSPGGDASTIGDAWTGELEYSLDALDGVTDNITFKPWRGEGADQPSGAGTDADSPAVLVLPPMVSGLILVKVPVFLQADPNRPHVDSIKLFASTQYDTSPLMAEQLLPHVPGDELPSIMVLQGEPVVEGDALVFDVVLSQPLAVATRIQLGLSSGDDDPATAQNERALVGLDTGEDLVYRPDGANAWLPLDEAGFLTIPAWTSRLQVRVETVDDVIPEGSEFVRLSIKSVEGGLTFSQTQHNQTAILDNDQDVNVVQGGLAVMPEVIAIQLRDAGPADVDVREAAAPMALPALDARDVMSTADPSLGIQALLGSSSSSVSSLSLDSDGMGRHSDMGVFDVHLVSVFPNSPRVIFDLG